MTTQNTALQGDHDRAADLPPKKNEKGEAAATASPKSNNSTVEGEVSALVEDTTTVDRVTPEKALATTNIEAVPSMPDRPLATRKLPEEETAAIEEITAEEVIAKHAEEAPSEDNGFSLGDVVATEQVVPANLARAAGANFRKPNDKEFVRVTENTDEIMPLDILEVDDKNKYIVTPAAMAAINKLHEEEGQTMIKTKRVMVYLAVNIDGVGFLWPITVMDDNTWLESAHNCATIAKGQWIRVVSNTPAKRYDYYPAKRHAGAVPNWPKETFLEMLNLAFRGRVIKSLDHPVIKQLLDED